jgi:hypothetical protein
MDEDFTGGDSPSKDQLVFYQNHGGHYDAVPYYVLKCWKATSTPWRVTDNQTYLECTGSAIKSFNTYVYADWFCQDIWREQ